jgi:hypothetical protein
MQLQFPPDHPLVVARTQVALPEGAFLRALPFTVDETQRFRIDALVLCAAIVASAYEQMVQLALRAKWEEAQKGATRPGRLDIAMFQHAWSIVDQLYALRQLIGSLAFKGEDVDAFMAATERAFVLRNRMDHLDQRIPNIVASKDNARSLFGSLSYFVYGAAVGEPEVDVFAVTQNAEPIRPGERVASFRMPGEMRMPIGNFVLSAAGEMLDLDAAILTLGPFMARTNEAFEKSIREQVVANAAEHGVRESDLLAHFGGGLKVMLAMKAGAPLEGPAQPESLSLTLAAGPHSRRWR